LSIQDESRFEEEEIAKSEKNEIPDWDSNQKSNSRILSYILCFVPLWNLNSLIR
jgi:hypothetical protein